MRDGKFRKCDIFIQNGTIKALRLLSESELPIDDIDCNGEEECDFDFTRQDEEIIDAAGLMAIPGLVDIHFHGAVGHDFCDADSVGLKEILDYELSRGIMSVCPATMTFTEEKLNEVIDNALEVSSYEGGARLVGINMEGPFINPLKAGAQSIEFVRECDPEMFRRLLSRAGGLIKIVDIAPECGNNMSFIDEFKDEVSVSLAHTKCDYDTAKEAFGRGAKQLTHMFNAMNDIGHREPGPVLAARESGAFVELIGDGVHNHDAVVRMVFDLFDEDRIILISDSMMATGLSDGTYTLGGQSVDVRGNRCTLSADPGVIAGSNSDLLACLKHVVKEAGVPLEKALAAATINPAGAIGLSDRYGTLAEGVDANVVLLDGNLDIRYLILKGKLIEK